MLSKWRLSLLVALTGSAGFVMGSDGAIDYPGLLWTSLGTFGAACCANALNQLYEIRNDARMRRTFNRPLPSGRMTPAQAARFALAAGVLGLGTLYAQTNPLTTGLGAANIVLYAAMYTPLKQLTIANTWVGAVVGAIPPLMGWASAAGQLEPGAAVLAAALFSWQLPHFLALAWMCKDDYLRGGFRMLSSFDAPGRRTAGVALRHAAALIPLGVAAHCTGVATPAFGWEAAGLACLMLVPAARFMGRPSEGAARQLFRGSLLYLPLLMLGAVVHRVPNDHTMDWAAVRARAAALFEGDGMLPLVLAAAGRTTEAAGRVLGLGMLGELRCPSKAQCKSEDLATTCDPQQQQQGQGQGQQQGVHAHASISSSSSSGSCSSIPTSSPQQGSGHQHHHHYQQQQGMGSKQGGVAAHGASHRHRLPSAGLDPQQLQRQQQLEEEEQQQQQQQQQQRQLHEKGGWWRRALW